MPWQTFADYTLLFVLSIGQPHPSDKLDICIAYAHSGAVFHAEQMAPGPVGIGRYCRRLGIGGNLGSHGYFQDVPMPLDKDRQDKFKKRR